MQDYQPVIGKTYTLFGNIVSTTHYYSVISQLTDKLLEDLKLNESDLLTYIQNISKNRQLLRNILRNNPGNNLLSENIHDVKHDLTQFTPGVEQHIRSAPVYKILTDRRLLTTREQYYMYMIEIELVNRLNKDRFIAGNYKIALLPYCLRETQTDCKAFPDEIDYVCKGCIKTCYINRISKLLRENNINPYIWRRTKLKRLFRQLVQKHGNIGVLGIACIVELVWGMRLCIKSGIPVVGIPLNANRCIRWMGDFFENSADLEKLEKLIV